MSFPTSMNNSFNDSIAAGPLSTLDPEHNLKTTTDSELAPRPWTMQSSSVNGGAMTSREGDL